MRKIKLIVVVLLCYVSISFAQIDVIKNTGNVGIGLSSNLAPLSRLTVGLLPGNTSALAHISSANPYTLQVTNITGTGIYAESMGAGASKAIAIRGVGGSETSTNAVIGIGVRGVAIKHGFGVSGLINSEVLQGAGIYGAVGSDEIFPTYGRYAGYFNGDVKVTGYLNGTTVGNSDVRYKKDISELDSKKSLKSILMMKPVEYRLEQQYAEVTSIDSVTKSEVTKQRPMYDEKSQVFQKKHYGLIAQELQGLYPDLVYEVDDRGYLGINYTEIIPMLIQSVQELNKKIETLESEKTVLKSSQGTTGIASVDEITGKAAVLHQNVPNPFNQSTEIRYYIPENSRSAQLCIYNLQGNQIKQTTITDRGEGTQVITGSELSAGMYLYALIVDGKEVDTKRMILTE